MFYKWLYRFSSIIFYSNKFNYNFFKYITNYNYGKYIIKAIESVLDQSLQNFEILIIDDGSTDESIEILKNYDDNPKINIIKQK